MYIITPLTITPAYLISGSNVPEPDTARGEIAWAAGTHAIDELRTYAGSVYSCVLAITTSSSVTPPNDPNHWLLKGPTNRMAPFDYYVSTKAYKTGTLTYKLRPGYFNALAMYGLEGYQYIATLVAFSGGPVTWTSSGYLYENAAGLYELLFSPLKTVDKLVFTDLPISPGAELTVSVIPFAGETAAIGMMNLGDCRALFGSGDWGGTEYGAEAEPQTYSYFKTNDDGTVAIVRRHSSTGVRLTVAMPTEFADAAVAAIQEVLDVPISCIGSKLPGYNGLNVFGLLSGSMRYEDFSTARLTATVKGFI